MASLQPSSCSLDEVLARPDIWRGDRLASAATPALSSRYAALDAELPGGGWPRGSISEILCDQAGIGEMSLLMPALHQLHQQQRCVLLVLPPHALYAPAWIATGADPAQLLVVAAQHAHDALWAVDQALASGALGAVLFWTRQISAAQVRRLEVGISGSHTLAWLFRPLRAQHEASACALRLRLGAAGRGRLAVDLLKRRGPPCARTLYLDIARPLQRCEDDETPLARRSFTVAATRSAGSAAVA